MSFHLLVASRAHFVSLECAHGVGRVRVGCRCCGWVEVGGLVGDARDVGWEAVVASGFVIFVSFPGGYFVPDFC